MTAMPSFRFKPHVPNARAHPCNRTWPHEDQPLELDPCGSDTGRIERGRGVDEGAPGNAGTARLRFCLHGAASGERNAGAERTRLSHHELDHGTPEQSMVRQQGIETLD